MSEQQKKSGSMTAIVAMICLFAMIAFVTNLAAPIGTVWKNQQGINGSNMLGMMGNMMNFLAYLCMGIPAGKLLQNKGYKATALMAIAVGFVGVLIQYLSGIIGVGAFISGIPANFFIYLLGAFVAGFSMCMLNTVVNPMLNLLGGGGNRSNKLLQLGGSANSLAGTLTPMLVGALIGQITTETSITDVNLVLYIALAVFAAAFVILSYTKIENPSNSDNKTVVFEASPWKFRHFVLGAVAIFVYVGCEVGIPGTLNFFLADISENGAGLDPITATATAGFVAGTYWLLMLVGRLCGSSISSKFSSKQMLATVTGTGVVLVLISMLAPTSVRVSMPVFTGTSFALAEVPIAAMLLVLCGLCTSVCWGCIFNLAVNGLGKYTEAASGIFMMLVCGGGVLPLLQNYIADQTTYMTSYWVIIFGFAYMCFYALIGSKNVNKDIKVD